MQLLLVDNRVKDVQTVTQSLLPGVDVVLVDFERDTYDMLIAKIPVKTYESVGIFEENYELNTYQLIHSFKDSVLTNIQIQDPNLNTWSEYKSLLSYFKNTLQITTLDLMGCNIHSSPDWKYVIEYLGKQFQININSSNDNTGSKDLGGNWILESGNQDLVGKYFSNNIEKYQFVLGFDSAASYVITTDNKLYGTGGNGFFGIMKDTDITQTSNFTSVPNITNITSLFVGLTRSSFVIKSDGSVWATGENRSGQLGTGNTKYVNVFTKVYNPDNNSGKTCTAVSCGQSHTHILLSDGSVLATGDNFFRQLGTSISSVNVFTTVYTPSGDTKCIAVSCGTYNTKIVLSDGSLWVTGANWNGELGTRDTNQQNLFTKVYNPINNYGIKCTSVSSGSYHTQIVLSDGSVWAAGYNGGGRLGTGNTQDYSVFTTAYNPVNNDGKKCTSVSCGDGHTQIVLDDGSVLAAGSNGNYQLGTGNTEQLNSFTTVYTPSGGKTCIAVLCGLYNTQMLLSDGSVLATGLNADGQLGTGNKTQLNSFTPVYTPSDGKTCTSVSCGSNHTLILLSDGSLQVAGYNGNGQLGLDNGVYNKLRYLDINVESVSSGSSTIAVIKSDGSLWVKGNNSNGQLGTGNKINVSVFTKVYDPTLLVNNGVKCIAVSCSYNHTQIVLSDGSLWTTGYNRYGQLGNGTSGDGTDVSVFTKVYDPTLLVNNGVKCIAVSCGQDHTQMLLEDGSVLVTGANYYNQLGNGNTTAAVNVFIKVYDPTLLVNNGVKCIAVSSGGNHNQILLSDGSVLATGLNGSGQLGTGNTTNRNVFTKVYDPTLLVNDVLVNNGLTCRAVSCGHSHTQILLSDGSVLATGLNGSGQLGTGNTTNRNVFTKVYDPTLPVNNGRKCREVSCSYRHTQIVLSNGSVLATGSNYYGELGTGDTEQKTLFTAMLNSDGTNMTNVLLSEMFSPDYPTISSVNATSLTRVNPTITISVASPSDSTIKNYSWSTDGTSYTVLRPPQKTSTLTISAADLTSGSEYTFRIKAINDVGTSEASDGVSATFTIPAAAPTISSVNATSLTRVDPTITISVANSSDTTIKNYSWSIDGTSYTVLSPRQKTSTLTIPAAGLTSGSEYTFRIKAINDVGTSEASDGVSATFTIPPIPPAQPTITNIRSTGGVTSISFQNPSDTSITNYAYSTINVTDIHNSVLPPFSSYTLLSPAQTTSPLTINGLHGVVQIKIKAFNGSYSNESTSFNNWYKPPFV
jgi:alpha-tubulin suppressor-like RCC1 family protein